MNARLAPPRSWARYAVVGLVALFVVSLTARHLRAPDGDWPWARIGDLPVQSGGRVKPLESLARMNLLLISGRATYQDVEGREVTAMAWFLDTVLNPSRGLEKEVFRIDHPQVIALFGGDPADTYYALSQLAPHFDVFEQEVMRLPPEDKDRDDYQRALAKLREAIALYDGFAYSFVPPPLLGSASQEYVALAQMRADAVDPAADPQVVAQARELLRSTYDRLARQNQVGIWPEPGDPMWKNLGELLLPATGDAPVPEIARQWAALAEAYTRGDQVAFAERLEAIEQAVASAGAASVNHAKVRAEAALKRLDPFLFSRTLYLVAFVVAVGSWALWPGTFGRLALALVIIGFAVHTGALGARMWVQGRPPVTSLYSSAIFIGWAAIGFALLMEALSRQRLALAAACLLGFATLLLAPVLEQQEGDTLGVMRAVLDSNFWLFTHVPTVALGYTATLLAGFLACFYLLADWTGRLPRHMAKQLQGLTYATVCFALLFSFVGTVLGGIWADQSWGRFWGWDPKENGALMIVLWNAIFLHARWGNLAGRTGLMQIAVFGNIITAWSWFGTNMLGAGLHSYGFMDQAFLALLGFVASQLIILTFGWMPPLRPTPAA